MNGGGEEEGEEHPVVATATKLPNNSAHNNHGNQSVDLDEETVYTYKGDSRSLADLPNSFFEFDSTQSEVAMATTSAAASSCHPTTSTRPPNQIQSNSSNNNNGEDPDFLEMDFDEGEPEEECVNLVAKATTTDSTTNNNRSPTSTIKSTIQLQEEEPGCSRQMTSTNQPTNNHDNRTTTATTAIETPPTNYNRTGKPNYKLNLSSRLVKSNTLPRMGTPISMATATPTPSPSSSCKQFTPTAGGATLLKTSGLSYSAPGVMTTATPPPSNTEVTKSNTFSLSEILIWTHEEAVEKSTNQLGKSACGPTAVVNVMTALRIQAAPSLVLSTITTRPRDEDGDLPEYLYSRSVAGTTHLDLIDGLNKLSSGDVFCKFFPIASAVKGETFTSWLLSWICRGATPLLTRNLQVQPPNCPSPLPDSWHHSMVYGTSTTHVYTANPLEAIEVDVLLPQLQSDSVLLVRREDVCTRMRARTDLKKLARFSDSRWGDMNVLGHVSNMLLEQPPLYSDSNIQKRTRTAYLQIPASYKSGVTLCILRDSPYYQDLVNEGGPPN